ncbi:MAG TPA: cupin domain-containing protein [Dehalococcoidia bacterium]|nr:cupin domain-containing protein [Dehalococcoidia bacterium]
MSETKYGKNIIIGIPDKIKEQTAMSQETQGEGSSKMVVYTDGEYNPGVNFVTAGWVLKESVNSMIHDHSHDEYLGLFGSDTDHPEELCGEIEITLGDEKHTITKSCVIFIPAGVSHGAIKNKKVDKPIFYFATTPTPSFSKENEVLSQD